MTLPVVLDLPGGGTFDVWKLLPCGDCGTDVFEVLEITTNRFNANDEPVTWSSVSVQCPSCCRPSKGTSRKHFGWFDNRTALFTTEKPA